MSASLLTILAALLSSPAVAQEENAPLELGRPSAKPIPIERPSLMPPPTESTETKKKLVKKKRLKPTINATVPANSAPTEPAASVPSVPVAKPIEPAAPLSKPAVAKPDVPNPSTPPASPAAPVVPAPVVEAPVMTKPHKKIPVDLAVNEPASANQSTSLRRRALLNFRFANIWAVRNRTNTGSFIASWDPVVFPVKRWNFGATIGVTAFESENVAGRPSEAFLVGEYGLTTSYYMSRTFLPELVIGAQYWDESGGASNNLLIAFNANILMRRRVLWILERGYVGFGSLRIDGGSTNLFRAGVGFRF